MYDIALGIVLYNALKDKLYPVTPPITNGKPENGDVIGPPPPTTTNGLYYRGDGLYTWLGYITYVDASASDTDYQDYLSSSGNGGVLPSNGGTVPIEFRADLTVSDTIAFSSPCPIGYRAVTIPRGYSTQSRCYNGD